MSANSEPVSTNPSSRVMPKGAWDCHTHVFGPTDRFPLAQSGAYAPPPSDQNLHLAVLDQLGLDHALLIQPSPYGEDHGALLDALSHGEGRLRGIGSLGASADRQTLIDMQQEGLVGLRFVGVAGPGGGAYPGTQSLDDLFDLQQDLRTLGLHAHVWGDLDQCVDLAHAIDGLPLVFDHLAGLLPTDLPGTYRFDRLVGALASDSVWMKLTYFRRSALPGDYGDMQPVISALVDAAPERLLWGSDWPFVRTAVLPDPLSLLDQLWSWIGEEAFRRCLVDNPAALFEVAAETP